MKKALQSLDMILDLVREEIAERALRKASIFRHDLNPGMLQ